VNHSASDTHGGQAFERDMTYIPDRILAGEASADPLDTAFPSGSKDSPREVTVWPAEPGRYRLVAARACPWAHRSIIVRRLLGLEDAIS
jgi:putative glutathione S-transferase